VAAVLSGIVHSPNGGTKMCELIAVRKIAHWLHPTGRSSPVV
jgi:hypothetical protein